MRKSTILIIIILIFGAILWFQTETSLVEPIGRLALVKIADPDIYPDHPNAKILAEYAQKRGSKCVLVVHYGGSSNYRRFMQDDVLIIELAYVSKEYRTDINWGEVISSFIFGVEDGKYRYKADGMYFETYDSAMDYVESLAESHEQDGSIPMFFHGTVRTGNPYINPGCGFPLYTEIAWKEYGRLGAYFYIIKGLIWPYVSNYFVPYQLSHISDLQHRYVNHRLSYTSYE